MVVRDLVDLAHPAEQLQQPSHVAFASAEHAGDIANPRRTKTVCPANQRRQFFPRAFHPHRQPDRMARQPHPGAVERDLPLLSRGPAEDAESRASAGVAAAACAAAQGRCRGDQDARVKLLRAASECASERATVAGDSASDGARSLQLRSASRSRATLEALRPKARDRGQRPKDRQKTAIAREAPRTPPRGSASACAASWASRSGVRRLRAGARRSRNLPPPIVR